MKKKIPVKPVIKTAVFCLAIFAISINGYSQKNIKDKKNNRDKKEQKDAAPKVISKPGSKNQRTFYGLASFYSNKFHGRKTANGEIFNQDKFTAACNILPLGTWIRVTNLRNGKSVVVRTTDRLHPKMRRLVDLSRSAAKKLNYINNGLARVKIEVLNQKMAK